MVDVTPAMRAEAGKRRQTAARLRAATGCDPEAVRSAARRQDEVAHRLEELAAWIDGIGSVLGYVAGQNDRVVGKAR